MPVSFHHLFNERLTRRGFLQLAALAAASIAMPTLFAPRRKPKSFWFLHGPTGKCWPVDDPVAWSLKNAGEPILERARDRLVTLDGSDANRVIRLVTRRCSLNLIEVWPSALPLWPERVTVHYWGQQGQGDLRPLFKQHGLTRRLVKVTLIDRKRESSTVMAGTEFLYGEGVVPFLGASLYGRKWQRRYEVERDDWAASPYSWSGFGWEGVEPNRIPWAALKSAWRHMVPFICPNCDEPTILTNFGLPWCGMFNREARFYHFCRGCRRMFTDHTIDRYHVVQWMLANLDPELLPCFEMIWGRPVKWKPAAEQAPPPVRA
jgi:hypothetical protein